MTDSSLRKTKRKGKRMALLMGICFLTGSLSACGHDRDVISTFWDVPKTEVSTDRQELQEQLQKEPVPSAPIKIEDLEQDIENSVTQKEEQVDDPKKSEDHVDDAKVSEESVDNVQVSEEEKEPEKTYITISAAGDVTLGNYLTQDYAWSFNEMYDKQQNPAYFFENVYDIFAEDDMTIVNLEGALTTAEEYREGTYVIKGAPAYVDILTQGSVEAVSMANNHRLDYKQQGTSDTVNALEGAGIKYAYDENVGIFETKGIRIGFISVNEVGWGTGVEKLLQEGIAKLQQEQVDLILACCHWGTERENYPEDYQRELGRKCIDWGVDLVIGHHPHVLQGIEEYQGKYIVYSLGNFCFGANRNPKDKDTMIFQQTFTFIDGEKTEETDMKIIPCSISSVTNRNDYKPTPAVGEDAVRITERVNEYSKFDIR